MNLALITARGGSKGLPGKNVKLLNGKPLIAYTIKAAIDAKCFDKIVVSTDDENIAKVAEQYGAEVPYLRPAHLANDTAKSIDVVLDIINFYDREGYQFERLFLLQPTSPLRTPKDIQNVMNLMREGVESVVAVKEAPSHPGTYFKMDNQQIPLSSIRAFANVNRQELGSYYKINGAAYCIDWNFLKVKKTLYGNNTLGYVMPKERSIDIDDEIDFQLAELLIKNLALHT